MAPLARHPNRPRLPEPGRSAAVLSDSENSIHNKHTMIFTVIILAILVGVAYYHYVQGMFTAAISTFCAFLATLIAFGYYEQIVGLAGQGKMADYAAGMVLLMLYGATYIVLRIILDAAVPGNILVPLYVEKAGAGVFGVLVGMFTAGVFAVAGQLMPFGPGVGGYERFPTDAMSAVAIPRDALGRNAQRDVDGQVWDQLKENDLDPARSAGMMVPVDDFVVSIASLSSSNALGTGAGSPTFAEVHPDFLNQAFANRLGPDRGGWRTFINSDKATIAKVNGVFTLGGTPEFADAELTPLRPNKTPLTYKGGSSDVILVVRAAFDDLVKDTDGVVRITPSAIRLLVGDKTYHPIGAMYGESKVGLYRLDDQIIIPMAGASRGADFAFSVPKALADRLTKPVPKGQTPKSVGFVEFRMFSRLPLNEGAAAAYTGPTEAVTVLRKPAAPVNGGAAKAQ